MYARLIARKSSSNQVAINLRLTRNQKRLTFSLNVFVEANKWDAKNQRIIGNAKRTAHLITLREKAIDYSLLYPSEPMQAVRDFVLEKPRSESSIIQVLEWYYQGEAKRLGVEISKIDLNTKRRYIEYFIDYLKSEKVGTSTESITLDHAKGFRVWLKTNNHAREANTASKALRIIKAAFSCALDAKKISSNPWSALKIKFKWKAPKALTDKEVEKLESQRFENVGLQETVDAFLFMCYTGLSVKDYSHYRQKPTYETDPDGFKFIPGTRKKSGEEYVIPLTDKPLQILAKYPNGLPLPNHYNEKIKGVAAAAGISPDICFKWARATCASLYFKNGASREFIALVLGHSNIDTANVHYITRKTDRVKQELKRVS